ncbi:IS110 family transposase ISCaa7 [subsurface metagenome]
MNKLIKKKHFIGVDISKDTLDLALLEEETCITFIDKKIENSLRGFDRILEWLDKQNKKLEDCFFCMEHTGTYGLLFFAWLSQMEIDYCVEPGMQIKRSLGMTRGKNDKVDARRIAEYAYTNKAKLKTFTMPSTLVVQIKQLLTYREQTVRIRSSLKNSLKSHRQYQRVSGLKKITKQIADQIEQQDRLVKEIEKQIVELIETDPQMKKNFELATSVKGIGFVIAAFMLVTTNNFTSFENGRKYACYSGIAPFEYTSGASIKGRSKVSHLGNKTIKTLLSNGANSASKWDPQLKAYYKRKEAEGKDHKLIMNSISCKLVNRVFAVVKRQTPYTCIYEHNFA